MLTDSQDALDLLNLRTNELIVDAGHKHIGTAHRVVRKQLKYQALLPTNFPVYWEHVLDILRFCGWTSVMKFAAASGMC